MTYGEGRKLVRTRLSRIADSICSESGSYSTDDIVVEFKKEIPNLKESEIEALIIVAANVMAGRIPLTKSNVNWRSPYISGLNLTKSIRLRLRNADGKYIYRNYPVQIITPKMIRQHEEGLPKNEKKPKDENGSHYERLRNAINKMISDGYGEDTPLSEYNGSDD